MEYLKKHVVENYKKYAVIMVFFILGTFLGVFFINQAKTEQKAEIQEYLNNFITELKNTENINQGEILQASLYDKLWLTISIWFFGTTIIGIPIVFGLVTYRGFCLGYTISSFISCLGFTKGFLFMLATLLLQNLIFIPALIGVSVSGFKFYQSIIKDRRKENIKISFVRHTIFSVMMLIIMAISSVIEVFISTNLLRVIIGYF